MRAKSDTLRAPLDSDMAFNICQPCEPCFHTAALMRQRPEIDCAALSSGMPYDFLVETFATERLKTLGVWSQFTDDDLEFRPASVARSVREHMVHQCLSEDGFFTNMLALPVTTNVLPETETCRQFIERYLSTSGERLAGLRAQSTPWFEGTTRFFNVDRSRAWVLVRRIAHTAHHRGQLSTYHRLLNHGLYSIYGPTADTGGLPANGAGVIYRYDSEASVLNAQSPPPLPGPGEKPATERPDLTEGRGQRAEGKGEGRGTR